jgi:hypothetical protein
MLNDTEDLHLAYMEARMELENRIVKGCHIPPPPKLCDCGAYHTRRHLLDNVCGTCKKKITN